MNLKKTNHDYAGGLTGNYHDGDCNGRFKSWDSFKSQWAGFGSEGGYDDTYHFLFRFDVSQSESNYALILCFLLQRKGIYIYIRIDNVSQRELDEQVRPWLIDRKKYMDTLWEGLD